MAVGAVRLADAAGLVAGWAADRLWADPRRGHPVAGYGATVAVLERRWHADSVAVGARFWGVAVAAPVALALGLSRVVADRPLRRAGLMALVTWSAVGGRQLGDVALRIADRLDAGDLDGARELVPWLVGRDPASLDHDGVVRAVVESVAENAADAVVASLAWGAVAGPAGVVAHRAVNTLDAMVGHRSPRHARFGRVAARADDVAGWVPARITAALVCLLAPAVGGSSSAAWATWRRDAPRHPSPNAGPVEAAAAGALGVRLGGPVAYGGRTEVRGPFGDGPAPTTADVRRVVRLSTAVGVVAAVASAAARVVGTHA